jgi:cytidine deaminase
MPAENIDHLISLAKEASLRSYSPYSKFPVGCALVTTDGKIFTGCNVENISFGLTICAERSAVFNAISNLGPEIKIARVLIYTPTNTPVTPCGACRQVLHEFGDDFEVVSVSEKNQIASSKIGELLPHTPAIEIRDPKK